MNSTRVQPRRFTGQSVRPIQPIRRKRHYVRNTFLGLVLFILIVLLAIVVTFLVTYATTEIPKPSQFARSQVSTVYYADGKTEIGKFAEVNREIIDTAKIPKHVGNAVVASEDRTFWTNSGVDVKGILRAFINNAKGRALQGASTLSQQYVDRYYMSENTTKGNMFQRYWAKAKEAILALKINRQQSKEEILDNYLNTIYFGRGAYGIQAAAKAYFGKTARELDYSESALLSGIIPAPSLYDPAVNPEMAKKRWLRVLAYMADSGYITPAQKLSAMFPPTVPPTTSRHNFEGVNGYFMFQARQELRQLAGLSEEQIDTKGLKIVTTINQSSQQLMMETVSKLPKGHADNLRVAMISTDPTTGEIIAEYPGTDYLKVQVNAATQDHFQAGSTFKPFGLIAYLEQGGSLKDVYNANSPAKIEGVPITNFGGYSYGNVTMARATALSLNVPFVRMNAKVGPALTKEVAIRLGYPDNTPGLDSSLTNVLGSSSPTAVDIATAFGTIANEGKRETVHLINQVTDSNGDIIYMPSFHPDQVMDRNVALTATKALQGPFSPGGTAARAQIGRPSAGKTGSSSDNKSAVFAGYIPQMVTVVGLYQVGSSGEEERITPFGGEREITGSTWPAWLWKQYMSQATKGLKVEQFDKPGKITKTEVKRSSTPGSEENSEESSPETVSPRPSTLNRATPPPDGPSPDSNGSTGGNTGTGGADTGTGAGNAPAAPAPGGENPAPNPAPSPAAPVSPGSPGADSNGTGAAIPNRETEPANNAPDAPATQN